MTRAALLFILAVGAVGPAIGFQLNFVSSLIQKASRFVEYHKIQQTSTEDPNLNYNFECVKDGLSRNPKECESYIQCSNGLTYTHPCPNSLHFNNETQNCESPCDAHCDPEIACECGWETCRDLKSGEKRPPWVPPYIPPAVKGPCKGNYQRYYCDAETQTCKPFSYGGCQGNDNNFEDEETCSLACHFPSEKVSKRARSFLPPDWLPPFIPPAKKGPCEGNFQRFYCEAETQTCKTFTYGGCQGNDNNFEDEEDCSLACRFPPDKKAQSVLFTCTEGERYPDFSHDCKKFNQCSNGKIFGKTCPEGLHFDQLTKTCVTPCKAYCDPTIAEGCGWVPYEPDWRKSPEIWRSDQHTETTSEIWDLDQHTETNSDIWESDQQTETISGKWLSDQNTETTSEIWGPDQHTEITYDDVCSLPYDKGTCGEHILRFFFDRTKGTCERFIYGGCSGNANNFQTEEECERRCLLQEDSQSPYSTLYSTQTDEFTCINNGLYPNTEDCSSYIQCSNGNPSVMPCPEGLHFRKETERCESPCDARCDSSIADECGWDKHVKGTFDHVCTLPWDFGTCGLYIHRFFFDTVTWRCRRFLYSGCDGNANNFRSLEECRRRCTPPEESQSHYSTIYSTKDDEITCIKDGLYSNPEDCTSYVRCSDGNPNIMSCPEGLHFNKDTESCENPCDARCDLTLAFECGFDKISENKKTQFHSIFLRVPDDCFFTHLHNQSVCQSFDDWNNTASQYCLDRKMQLSSSSELLPCGVDFFAGIQFVCCSKRVTQDEQISTEDSQSILSETEIFTESYRMNQFSTDFPSTTPKTPCIADGLYPDPEDCSRFIQCSGDQTYPMPCPYGLHFSEINQRCEMPCDARCNMTLACRCGWPECNDLEVDCEAEPSSGPCRTSTSRYYYDIDSGKCRRFTYGGCGGNTNNFISERECKQKCQQKLLEGYRCPFPNGKFADFFNCISYYDCKRGNPTLKRCPRGRAFDYLKSTCVSEEEAKCLYKCRENDAVYSYPLDCRKYIDCVNGISKIERCPYGEAFDRRTRQCVEQKTVGCTRS